MKLNIEKTYLKNTRTEKENFTSYEKFMYEDNQRRSPNSAPGLQTNLAGGNYKNKYDNTYTTLSGSNAEGFDKLYNKTSVGVNIYICLQIYIMWNNHRFSTQMILFI